MISTLKTHSLWCSCISQATRMMRDLSSFFQILGHTSDSTIPPIREAPCIRLRSKSYQTPFLEDELPNLSCEDTRDQDMPDCLLFFITQGTRSGIWQPSFSQSIGCPTSILDCQPNKEFAAEWSPRFPNPFIWHKLDGNKRVSIIS